MNYNKETDFTLALQYYQTSQFNQAETICRNILEVNPTQSDALHLLGIMKHKANQNESAEKLIRKAIAINPRVPMYYNTLGTILSELGKPSEAITYHTKVLEFVPEDIITYNNLAFLYKNIGKLNQAFSFYQKTLDKEPENIEALKGLGDIHLIKGEPKNALAIFKRAITLDPNNVEIYNSIALIYQYSGSTQQAIQCFQDIIAIAPHNLTAYCYLAKLSKPGKDDPLFNTLGSAINKTTTSLYDALQISFTLGKMYSDIANYDQAFHYYALGNTLRGKISPYTFDIHRYKETVATYKSVFNSKFFAERKNYGIPTDIPLFIVGMPRSGTSLVEQIIASHPDCFGAGELDLIHEIEYNLLGDKKLKSFAQLIESITRKAIISCAEQYMENIISFSKKPKIIDKMPHNFNYLWLIALMFPRAKIIHCCRNPVDTCISCYFNDFQGAHLYKNDLKTLGLYYREYQNLMDHWQRVLPITILNLEYETLVTNESFIIKKIIDYCGLSWNESCLHFYQTKRFVNTVSNQQIRQKLYTDSINRWLPYKKYLNPLFAGLGIS